jgi:hypothetical protein
MNRPRQEALDSFPVFVDDLWAALGLPRATEVQLDIADYLQHGPQRRMVKAFRGVGKSWLTAAYALWCLCREQQERVLVISGNSTKAREFTTFCRSLIEMVDWLEFLAPDTSIGQRDSVEAFDVAGALPHQQPSMKSIGVGGQLQGNRATIIIPDDVETMKNSLTQTLRDRLSEAVKEFDAILIPDGKPDGSPCEIIYLGTDQTEMSLYKQLPGRGYEVRVWPARMPKNNDKWRAYGDSIAPLIASWRNTKAPWEPTDPQRFHEEDLVQREASYGRSGFAMQFMLDPSVSDMERYPLKCSDLIIMDSSSQLVPTQLAWGKSAAGGGKTVLDDLDCRGLTGDTFYGPMFIADKMVAPGETMMFVDPSGRGKDELAVAIGRAFGPTVYVVAIEGWLDGYADKTLQEVVALAKLHGVNRAFVEPNYGGGVFSSVFSRAFQDGGHPVSVEDAEWAKGQKELRIIDTVEPMMVQHRVVMAETVIKRDLQVAERRSEAGAEHAEKYSFVYQLTRMNKERGALVHDDRVEAFAGLLSLFESAQRETARGADERAALEAKDAAIDQFLYELDNVDEILQNGLGGPRPAPVWNRIR